MKYTLFRLLDPACLLALYKKLIFNSVALVDKNVRILSSARVNNICKKKEAIRIGAHSVIAGELTTFGHGGDIEIGEWCYIGEGSRIWSAARVSIGSRVLVAHNVNIHDTNSHPVDAMERHNHFREIITNGHPENSDNITSRPIKIEDDVWIGFNSIILKGVTIGSRSIIAAGSIVTCDVPPQSVFIQGKIIRRIDDAKHCHCPLSIAKSASGCAVKRSGN